ncbi:MAG: putative DNA binding domain-containing protein [Proteobacteria bacterium]|nr:putative DNA binding domain-containing protein [Pseudomonadota bacterium]
MELGKELFGEGKNIEFKAEIPKHHENFLKDIVAFSNASGGKIILGIEDGTGIVVGIGEQNPFRISDSISNMIDDACVPQIYTDISPRTIDGKTILEIEVFPGRQRPYYLKSRGKEKSCYIRINGTSRIASERKLKELEMEGMRISFDSLPEIGKAFDREDALALCEKMYQTALSACKTQAERDDVKPMTLEKLEDFGILRKDGHHLLPTHAYVLLTKPRDRYVKIQCALFKGTVRDEFIDRKEFDGPIHEQLEMAHQFVLRHINRGAIIDGLYRRDIYELPTSSIREMIINAVLHRSYLDESCIQVSLYDDRLEIDSPGMLYDGLTVEEAKSGKSRCRNKAIAEAFQYMKLIEGWGTGLPRLYKRCEEMGLQSPHFEEFGDGMRVTIYRNSGTVEETGNVIVAENQAGVIESQADVGINGADVGINGADVGINGAAIQVVELLRQNNRLSAVQIADCMSLSSRQVERILSDLKQRGYIKRVGANKTGYWLIVNDNH